MNDTRPEIWEKWLGLFAARTPSERVSMGSSMFDTAREIVLSAIQREQPGCSAAQVRRELFLRFYGKDFDPPEREKIVTHLMRENR